ncbi:putative bifunctional diguanylate cyclase/phosphodiesterase [Agrobacterium tumefaciens]|uniref:putative bifunctional diguanylate cyclase/phosphodiesterase n=1 Tax=Agrobacterium tumefaciens TaxID=358 RepID=UPI001571E1E5|nr:EAL domain-containing protein [Agrobacterium tumefaciens]NTA45109.1 EAL domain-containing protein [Agrobacterium tumefaciens]WIE34008.1 EAL domain-containing protein [Agrobacterium tumefaciens]
MPFQKTKDREEYSQHLLLLCRVAAWMGVALATGWFVFFILTERWGIALSLLILGVAIVPCWLTCLMGHFSLGLILAQSACILFVCWYSVAIDVSDDTVPRTTHLYLLVIIFVGYMNFQRQRSAAQFLVIAASLAAFVYFCASAARFSFSSPMPQDVRSISAWFNSVFAALMLCGGVAAMQAQFRSHTKKALELRSALSNGQFELFYQAQVRADGTLLGAEALLRWNHPKRGYIPPADFIALAQQTGFMPTIGAWVIAEACKTLARWQENPATQNLTLSINITADHFVDAGFSGQLLDAASSQGIKPQLLKLELTESVFLFDIEAAIAKMKLLDRSGFTISLDDFGTGYSSLSYLRQLPLKQIKIDRSFVTGVTESGRMATITRNIVQMGHDLSLEVLAEGVETEAELRMMLSYGCRLFQGYLFARPTSLVEFEQYAARPSS